MTAAETAEREPMLTHRGTYVIRFWTSGKEICRIEVVHVQTGERAVLRSTADALAWIDRRSQQGHTNGP